MEKQTQWDPSTTPNESELEKLRSENQQMREKLQSEAGAIIEFQNDLSPEVENMFLQNVMAFEEASQNMQMVSLYQFLGCPEYKKIEDIAPDELPAELNRLKQLLEEKQVMLDVIDEYDDAVIYKFITNELFLQETYESLIPGMVRHFTYEAFHPNHKLDIQERALDFLGDWFDRSMNEYSWELSAEFVLPNATVINRSAVVQRIKTIFASYVEFKDCRYSLCDISYEWNEEERKGLGYAEGVVNYQAVPESGEPVEIEGSFKLYLSNEGAWWNIYYFIFPGFTWHDGQQ